MCVWVWVWVWVCVTLEPSLRPSFMAEWLGALALCCQGGKFTEIVGLNSTQVKKIIGLHVFVTHSMVLLPLQVEIFLYDMISITNKVCDREMETDRNSSTFSDFLELIRCAVVTMWQHVHSMEQMALLYLQILHTKYVMKVVLHWAKQW